LVRIIFLYSENSESALLFALQERFESKRFYTFAGDVLLALNPYDVLPTIYDDTVQRLYRHNNKVSSLPALVTPHFVDLLVHFQHVFSVAEKALARVENEQSKHEAICFCGESGSGKTFVLMRCANYLISTSAQPTSGRISTVQQLEAVERVLDAFGAARTLKNSGATRTAYYVEFMYRRYRGFAVRTTLQQQQQQQQPQIQVHVEPSRIVMQRPGECNFNVFYELCAGLDASEKRKLGLKSTAAAAAIDQQYFYLNQGKVPSNEAVERRKFEQLCSALQLLGISEHQQNFMHRILATILHIGNLFFKPTKRVEYDSTNNAPSSTTVGVEIANEGELKWCAYLLEVQLESLHRLFTKKQVVGT
uniref:Myosin motor domain-containing protein n=1 Tax=Gongylonema pulchrum TaxID=637853 RepID=A0A183DZE9_9BILA